MVAQAFKGYSSLGLWDGTEGCTAVQDYGAVQERNGEHRPRQEDAHTCIDGFGDDPKQAFFAVYDGDGGDECSKFASECLHQFLLEQLQQMARKSLDADEVGAAVQACISRTYLQTDKQLEEEGLGQLPNSGTTAVTCLIRQEGNSRYLYTGNVGDCRAVLSHGGAAFRITRDHYASDHVRRIVRLW